MLADAGAQVTIIEMGRSVGTGIESITRRQMVRELRRRGVEILTDAKVVAIEPHYVISEDAEGQRLKTPAEVVCLALGWRSRGAGLAAALERLGVPVVTIGDAERPADFVAAINAGANAGLAL
jgi:2,4-dienoyl-CoA reductase (NADPH2)